MSTDIENVAADENAEQVLSPEDVVAEPVVEPAETDEKPQEPEAKENDAEADEGDEKPEDEEAAKAEAEEKTQRKNRTAEYIQKLKDGKRDAERREKALKDRLKLYEGDKPSRDDFDDPDDFEDARLEYATKKARRDEIQHEIKTNQKQVSQETQAIWNEHVADAKERYEDFEQVVYAQNVPIDDRTARMLMESDQGADVAYYLGKNPSKAQELAGLDDITMARAIGRMEADVNAAHTKPKNLSKAPPPVEEVGGKAGASGVDLEAMSYEEYRKHNGFD